MTYWHNKGKRMESKIIDTYILIHRKKKIRITAIVPICITDHKVCLHISVQLLSCIWLLTTPWTVACQASLSITNSQSLLKLMSIKSVMPSNHLILCCPLLLLHSILPNIRVFSNESVLHIRWPTYWVSASASVLPVNIQDWFPLGLTDLISLQPKGLSRVFSNTTVQRHQFFDTYLSLWSNSHIHTWLLEKP